MAKRHCRVRADDLADQLAVVLPPALAMASRLAASSPASNQVRQLMKDCPLAFVNAKPVPDYDLDLSDFLSEDRDRAVIRPTPPAAGYRYPADR
jgi:hypothetical protein